jgi:hypothetical protein
MDDAIRPLAGADVQVVGQGSRRVTGDDGAFAFGGLAPGDYVVKASKEDFAERQVTVHVVAGDESPEVVRLLLAANASLQPYANVQKWSGFLACGVGTDGGGQAGRSVLPCAAIQSTGVVHSDTVHDFPFNSAEVPAWAQAEMVWKGTQAFGNDLKMDFPSTGLNVGGNGSWAASAGGSPLTVAVDTPTIVGALGSGASNIEVRVLPGSTQPVTVTLQQGFDVFMSYFFGFTPRDGWTFVADGACDAPDQCS